MIRRAIAGLLELPSAYRTAVQATRVNEQTGAWFLARRGAGVAGAADAAGGAISISIVLSVVRGSPLAVV